MNSKLNILWVNDNPQAAHSMVFMYATNAKMQGWFDEVEIIIWGPTAKLVSEDTNIQERIKLAQHVGVVVKACISCSNMFGVTDKLKSLEIEVDGMGIPLTNILKENEKLITI